MPLSKGRSELTAETSDPIGVRDLLRPPDPPFYRVGVRSRHVARRHGLEREPSAGGLARPLHLMLMDKACSAAAERETAFVRPRCAPRITKVHSTAAYAALNGYDGTTLFHHAAYAASYTARSATQQTTPQATPGAVSSRRGMDMLDGGFPGAEQGNPGMRSPLPAMP